MPVTFTDFAIRVSGPLTPKKGVLNKLKGCCCPATDAFKRKKIRPTLRLSLPEVSQSLSKPSATSKMYRLITSELYSVKKTIPGLKAPASFGCPNTEEGTRAFPPFCQENKVQKEGKRGQNTATSRHQESFWPQKRSEIETVNIFTRRVKPSEFYCYNCSSKDKENKVRMSNKVQHKHKHKVTWGVEVDQASVLGH